MATIRKEKLSDPDRELLEKIFLFSGYTTSKSISNFVTDRDISNNRRFLYRMIDGGYLKQMSFYSDSDRDLMVYQITGKTCKLFQNPDSYFRKKHADTYIIRALAKQHFLFEIANEFLENIITTNESRIQFLCKKLDVHQDVLPKKHNDDASFTHIEEYILDFTKHKKPELICKTTNEELINNAPKDIAFVYIDKFQSNPSAQLLSLTDKYKALIKNKNQKIFFIVVVDSDIREKQYKSAAARHFGKSENGEVFQIPNNVINLHKKILEDEFSIENSRLMNLDSEIKKKFSDQDYSKGIDVDENLFTDMANSGVKAIEYLVEEILKEDSAPEVKLAQVKELFGKIYKIYSTGLFQKWYAPDIRIYKIGHKFSL